MSLKNQKKPPLGPLNPSNNLDEDPPVDKRRKVGLERMAGPTAAGYRARQPLTPVNAGPNAGDQAAAAGSDGGSSAGGVEFSSREDVEHLLNERIRARKNDLKGKSEEAIVLLRKFKSCVRWQIEVEDGCKLELEKLQSLLDSEAKRHSEDETQLKNKIEELNSLIADLHTQYAKLQERLNKEEADKLAMTKSYEDEREAKVAAQKSQNALSEELERISQEFDRAKAQIKVLQENIRRLELYNRGMEQYNSNIHAEDLKKKETISKLEEEKNTMAQSLNCQRSKIKSLEELLKTSKDSEQKSIKQKEELKNEVDCLQSELQQVRDDHNNQLRQVQRLEELLKSSKHSQQEAVEQKEELKEDVRLLRIELEQVRDDRDCQLSKVQSLTAEVASYKELTGKSNKDLENIMTENCELEKVSLSQREEIQIFQHKLAAANEKLKMADLTAIEILADYEDQKKMVKDLQNRVADAEIQIFEGEKLRKKLHNTILELKGNIRVFCRVRPVLSDSDCNISEGPIVSYPTSMEVLGRGIDLMHHEKTYSFTFDKVFNHEASQEDVFDEISPLMQSALDGYKVCIFAYGQTGSGKTYTMMGKPEAAEQKGLIPRSLEEIFQISQSLQSQGWKYKMQASMLEIYNESIRDLLSPGRPGILDATVALHKQYTIKHDSNGNTHVSDLTIIDVCSIKEVSFLLQQAAQSRSVSKTHMNEQSSRSHFVFTLRISGVNENTEQQVQGVLNLIDLAGSERLNKSGSTGDRLKETQAINKSLSALSDVIFAIAKKDDHVPFRNSKLTYLLQPCLGGDSKTLMFVNVSPESSSTGESICSLRFAARVNSCEIGVPRRHTQARPLDSRLSCG